MHFCWRMCSWPRYSNVLLNKYLFKISGISCELQNYSSSFWYAKYVQFHECILLMIILYKIYNPSKIFQPSNLFQDHSYQIKKWKLFLSNKCRTTYWSKVKHILSSSKKTTFLLPRISTYFANIILKENMSYYFCFLKLISKWCFIKIQTIVFVLSIFISI